MLTGVSFSERSDARLPGKEESKLDAESQVGLLTVGDCDCFKIRMIEGELGRKYCWPALVKSPQY